MGDAHVVLLRGASHGTHEFHRERGEITKRLLRFLWPCRDGDRVPEALRKPRLERDRVIYRPEGERGSFYLSARLPAQFDAVLRFDETHAVEPLEPGTEASGSGVPKPFPFAV